MLEPYYLFLRRGELDILIQEYDLKEFKEGDCVYYANAKNMDTRYIENKPLPIVTNGVESCNTNI